MGIDMVGINATRDGLAENVNEAIEDARLIGWDDKGHACVWYGGYSFSVYDVVGDWSEVGHFTNGDMVDSDDESKAAERMENEGFTPV